MPPIIVSKLMSINNHFDQCVHKQEYYQFFPLEILMNPPYIHLST